MSGKAGIYGVLAVIGFVVPAVLVGKFIAMYGLDFQLLVDQVFGTLGSKLVFMDVMVSSIVFWVFMAREAPKAGMSWWWYVPLNLVVGLSFALPLFLFNRERNAATA